MLTTDEYLLREVGDDPDLFIGVRPRLSGGHEVKRIEVAPGGALFKIVEEKYLYRNGLYAALIRLYHSNKVSSVGLHGGWELYRPV